ncbi:MAG: GH36-type glycosyl hydrolase domain-containing protein [Armatimonadota bacterium]
MSEYGHFSEDGREYIITRPDTPRPWINYLSNDTYCGLCSQTGGGYSFFETSGYNRITREYPPLELLRDRPGRFVYLHDRDTGDYWNINWQPVTSTAMTAWESRHSMGRTCVSSVHDGIEGKIAYFVPKRDPIEVWMVEIRNSTGRTRRITSFSSVEWSLGNYAYNLTESAFAQLFNEISYEEGIIFATSRFWNVSAGGPGNPNLRWDKFAFLTSSILPAGYDCIAEAFMGLYRGWQNPLAVERGHCSNSTGNGRDIVGVLQHDFELAPGESQRFLILLGVAYRKEDARNLREHYDTWEEAEHSLREVDRYWDDYLSRNTCRTPDDVFALSFNIWNKYQAWITSRWSRMDSYYIGGSSIVGFRDSWQDMLGILPNDVGWARQKILYMLEHQFPDGSTLHNWDPLTNIGVKTGHSDDPLWLVLGVIEYLKESGDLAFLDQPAVYYDGGSETVRQHLIHALDYSLSRMSPRGVSLIEAADWNDGLDQIGRQGRGESTMVSEHLVWMLRETSELLARTGREDLAEMYGRARDEIIAAVNEHLWDGRWYARGTRDDGQMFGSQKNEEGKIYLNSQSWAVMSGLAPNDRAVQCMNSVEELLDTDYGPALLLPAFTEPNPKIGIITRFAPGTKENGTVFNHPVCWTIMAECMLGRGSRAYDIWRRTSFMLLGEEPEVYKAEPYVYSEYVHGPDSVTFGQGEFSWMTGTAAWMWKVCLEWILGVRPVYDGLLVDPCVPGWETFNVKRRFRDATYEINFENPKRLEKGTIQIVIDGDEYPSNIIPPFKDGRTHEVRVIMG